MPSVHQGAHDEAYLIPGDVKLDHMEKEVPAHFLHCEVTIFPLAINKYLFGGRTFQGYANVLKLLPTKMLASINGSCLQQVFLRCSDGSILFSFSFLLFLNACLLIYLFIYLLLTFIYVF